MHLVLVLVAALLTQPAADHANFTGTWKMIPARSASPNQTPPVTEMLVVIEQTADQIRLDMTSGVSRTVSVSYPFIVVPKIPADSPSGDERRAYWDGKRLVVERGGTISGQTVSTRQALTLNADGTELTVDRLVIVQHGYTLRGAKNYAEVSDVFARVPR
jgi:hypothetical protein